MKQWSTSFIPGIWLIFSACGQSTRQLDPHGGSEGLGGAGPNSGGHAPVSSGGTVGAAGTSGNLGGQAHQSGGLGPTTVGSSGGAGTLSSGGMAPATMGGIGGQSTGDGNGREPTTGGDGGETSAGGASTSGGHAGTVNSGGSAGATGSSGGSSGSNGIGGTGPIGTAGVGGTGNAGVGGTDNVYDTNVSNRLDGVMLWAPCLNQLDARLCLTKSGNCAPNNDRALAGALLTDRTLVMGGAPGHIYTIGLHIQGVAEATPYRSGADSYSTGAQEPANGFYTGGEPDPATARLVFMIRVGSPARDYFLNSIATETDSRLRLSVFAIDYVADIKVEGGTTVRLVVADPNCNMTINCADPAETGATCNPVSVKNLDPKLLSRNTISQPYNGQFLGMVVTNVRVD
jgi:hypothetical protein